FGIPEDGDVSIEVYNLQGRLIATLLSQNIKAGYHSVTWNADNHSSGMYFVQMVSGEYLKTQKLMLVK
ncbi:MAG: T9SS type A sorting domain-containing protein, partial [Candidatus Marinimicrobia bacterium]|nr:T9SS type A sorting domain-containing protein [Candidatus Neomarinimicrobiota bacterium]